MWVFIVFLLIPWLEIKLLVKMGVWIGFMPTLLLCVVMAIIGSALIRAQGIRALTATRESLMHREMPVRTLFDGLCLAMAGLLFIIPGFLTDILGLCLLMPPVRTGLFYSVGARFGDGVEDYRQRRGPPPPRDPRVIEGEFTRLDRPD